MNTYNGQAEHLLMLGCNASISAVEGLSLTLCVSVVGWHNGEVHIRVYLLAVVVASLSSLLRQFTAL